MTDHKQDVGSSSDGISASAQSSGQLALTQPLPHDPLSDIDLAEFGRRLRGGKVSAESTTGAYLTRIEHLDPRLGTFRSVAAERALNAARGVDLLLRSGTDLGPLMGVPVAIKEIFAIRDLPFGAGTEVPITDLVPEEGPFVRRLKQAGVIILGTTKTTEFAASTINVTKDPPWNPFDAQVKRACGGSSHGSAAALAAGLCAFSVGSDTGGSVRLPAALCGVVGYKATAGQWPTEGIFPLSHTFDSVGVFTRSATDAALIHETLCGRSSPIPPRPNRLRFGRPTGYFTEDIDPYVTLVIDRALARIAESGADIIDVDIPETDEVTSVFARIVPAEHVAFLGMERLLAARAVIDPVVWDRIESEAGMSAETLLSLQRRQRELVSICRARMAGFDAWLMPTAPLFARPLSELADLASAIRWNRRAGRFTRLGNLFGQCGVSLPVQGVGKMPIGLQIMCNGDDDAWLLAIVRSVEAIVGRGPGADVSGFSMKPKNEG